MEHSASSEDIRVIQKERGALFKIIFWVPAKISFWAITKMIKKSFV